MLDRSLARGQSQSAFLSCCDLISEHLTGLFKDLVLISIVPPQPQALVSGDILFFFFFETGPHCVALAVLKLTM